MWKRTLLSLAAVAALSGFVAYPLVFASTETSDCPGKVVCPVTGEEVCKDRCPLLDAERSDCPGKVECPLDAELVCRDECPLEMASARKDAAPSCCQNRE